MEMLIPPKQIGRDFVEAYYNIMNKSPENLYRFYTESATFTHDDIDPKKRRTINADGMMAIRDAMQQRLLKYKHTKTKVHTFDSVETLNDGVIVRVSGEISFNEQPMRPFCQSVILVPKSPIHYFVQNDMFRFCDFESDTEKDDGDDLAVKCQSMPTIEKDWGTQCEEDIEPSEERSHYKQTEPRDDCTRNSFDGDAHENEVKMNTSDSGLSSDAEKAIMDIQSLNLKNILQETRNITKESVMKRGSMTTEETEPPVEQDEISVSMNDNEISENHNQLFRDSCVLTIGNVVNPNIEFENAKGDENMAFENEVVDTSNESKHDENSSSSKSRFRKRKEKRKSRGDITKEQVYDSMKEPNEIESTAENNQPPTVQANEIVPSENAAEKAEEKPTEEKKQDTPKTIEKKSYADLAKSGKQEWVDASSVRRDSVPEKYRTRSSLSRRGSRHEQTTSPNDRYSPKNDQLQVFIGNIPHTADEDEIRKIFSRFGRLVRVRLHLNLKKEWLPRYAFISYDNLQSVRNCLMNKATFYWPENSPDGQKLNVNGDPTVDMWDDNGKPLTVSKSSELKQFGKSFVLDTKSTNNKRSTNGNISEAMKTERFKK